MTTDAKTKCAACYGDLPVHHFPGATPERQRVFTVRDGARIHAGGCSASDPAVQTPSRSLRVNEMTGETGE